MARKTRGEVVSKYESLIQGIKKHWAKDGPRSIGGRNYATADAIAQLQRMLDAVDATAAAYAVWRSRVADQRTIETKLRQFLRFVEGLVRTQVGGDASVLADFGLQPSRKTGPRTTEAKVSMVKRAKATRLERHTMGKRQKKNIKG